MKFTYANPVSITASAASLSASLSAPALFAAAAELMEPRVSRYAGVLPQAVCQELIRLGEETGFNVIEESIDDHQENPIPSQSIEVLMFGDGRQNEVINQPIWDALKPYLGVFADLVKKTRKDEHLSLFPDEPDREPELDWIFFRKYSPTSNRNSLIPHVDTNVFTLNIALNDNFEGGGLFYVKPPMQDLSKAEDGRPELNPKMMTYEWANTVKRENTSELVFPDMMQGDVLIHNFTVWHGVAPLDKGERYSFVLFYDMDNPIIKDLVDDLDDGDGIVAVEFYHEIEDAKVVLAFVEELNGTEILEPIIDPFPPFEKQDLDSYEGHKFKAIVEGTGEVLADFVVSIEKELYVISKPATDSRDEL
eukprot:scaffold3508_cov149-Skeletonema_menzelii.AAC.10